MVEAVNLALTFWTTIMSELPNTPFFFLFALAIVLIIANNIFAWVKGGR